ncbi:MAG: hypothetical protein RLZZ293_440 [Pseudomonadota bacterium]|jgi:hypothetical protein
MKAILKSLLLVGLFGVSVNSFADQVSGTFQTLNSSDINWAINGNTTCQNLLQQSFLPEYGGSVQVSVFADQLDNSYHATFSGPNSNQAIVPLFNQDGTFHPYNYNYTPTNSDDFPSRFASNIGKFNVSIWGNTTNVTTLYMTMYYRDMTAGDCMAGFTLHKVQ